ncbi:MAG: hypothetical protein KAH95_17925 [Spirochaetales bacterium]|nr:hypothetical protein [Spirochaetales bacterium]
MEITLNSEPFDVTIENEKTLHELFKGLSEWLNGSGYEITGLVKDKQELELNNNDWENILLDTINNLDIKAISGLDKYISDLQTLYQYVTLLQNAIIAENRALTTDLLSELSYITSTLDSFLTKKDLPVYGTIILQERINDFLNKNTKPEKSKNDLIEILNKLSLILQTRIKEATSPFLELQTASEQLKNLIPSISDVSVMLQTGDDKKAMDSVLNFIDLSEKLIRLFPFLKEIGYTDIRKGSIDSESFNDFYTDLNGILIELVDAFNINDSILIGDLMEYEIAPRVNKLLEYVKLIEKVKEDNTGETDVS